MNDERGERMRRALERDVDDLSEQTLERVRAWIERHQRPPAEPAKTNSRQPSRPAEEES